MQAAKLRAEVVTKIAQSLAAAYETVYSAVADPSNGYNQLKKVSQALEHSPDNVKMILGVLA